MASITSKKNPRLHLFTGKGGTGKTTLAQAFTLALKKKGSHVLYIPFDQSFDEKFYERLKLPALCLDNDKTVTDYMGEKLGSHIIASWIASSHFFKSLYQMLPSVHYLILLAEILKRLEEDKKLHLVVDLPSTGHALTLLEGADNFLHLFKKGALYNDVKEIKERLYDPTFSELIVCSLASELSHAESLELLEALEGMKLQNIHMAFNHVFSACEGLDAKKLPKILQKKIKAERTILEREHKTPLAMIVPYLSEKEPKQRVLHAAQLLGGER